MGRSVADTHSRLAGVVGRRSTSDGALTRRQVTEDWLRSPSCSPTIRPRSPNLSNVLSEAIIILQYNYNVVFTTNCPEVAADDTRIFYQRGSRPRNTGPGDSRPHPVPHRMLHDAVITTSMVKGLKYNINVRAWRTTRPTTTSGVAGVSTASSASSRPQVMVPLRVRPAGPHFEAHHEDADAETASDGTVTTGH